MKAGTEIVRFTDLTVSDLQEFIYPAGKDLGKVEQTLAVNALNENGELKRVEYDDHSVVIFGNPKEAETYLHGECRKSSVDFLIRIDDCEKELLTLGCLGLGLTDLLRPEDVVRLVQGDYWYLIKDEDYQADRSRQDRTEVVTRYTLLDDDFGICGTLEYTWGSMHDYSAKEDVSYEYVRLELDGPKYIYCDSCKSFVCTAEIDQKVSVTELTEENYGDWSVKKGKVICPVCGKAIEFESTDHCELVDYGDDTFDE